MKEIKNVAIVSLSAGTIGEDFVKHETDLGYQRLKDYGLNVKLMPHACSGIAYVKEHPQDRAADLIEAFKDDSIDMIYCAIGGDDTYRIAPYLFENDELKKVISDKVFLGFSDTTMNHFMLRKLGLNTFYGQSFLADTCELDKTLLPYSAHYFEELIKTGSISKITPSDVWYEDRTDWSPAAVGTPRIAHKNEGFVLLQGPSQFSGEIFGGCIDSMYDLFTSGRYADTVEIAEKYGLFPDNEYWKGKILLLESSEEEPDPEKYADMLKQFRDRGVFDAVSGIICGKPHNNKYYEEYCEALKAVIAKPELPIMVNLSVGHAYPHCIIPFGVKATVDTDKQEIVFDNK